MDGVCGVHNIASMWGKDFKGLLHVSEDMFCREPICTFVVIFHLVRIPDADEVRETINSIKSGKSPDHHDINSEQLKFGINQIHGYIPKNFMLSSPVSLVKISYKLIIKIQL